MVRVSPVNGILFTDDLCFPFSRLYLDGSSTGREKEARSLESQKDARLGQTVKDTSSFVTHFSFSLFFCISFIHFPLFPEHKPVYQIFFLLFFCVLSTYERLDDGFGEQYRDKFNFLNSAIHLGINSVLLMFFDPCETILDIYSRKMLKAQGEAPAKIIENNYREKTQFDFAMPLLCSHRAFQNVPEDLNPFSTTASFRPHLGMHA